MHIHTDARTRQMYVHMSYTRAVGVSNTVIKGDGNSRSVGSKRRDREDVVDVAVPRDRKTCQKKPKKSHRIPHTYLSEALTIFPPKLSYKTNTSMLLISSDATNTAQGIIKLTR